MEDWAVCESRGPVVRNSLKHEISRLRAFANRARKAYSKEFMATPFGYIADAYDEAADALQKRLDAATANDRAERTRPAQQEMEDGTR